MNKDIRQKIRALTEDMGSVQYEVFRGNNYKPNEFNISEIKALYINDEITEDYNYDGDLNEIVIDKTGFSDSDLVRVEYIYHDFSDKEILGYIEAALTWISIFSYKSKDYDVQDEGYIYPQPDSHTEDLIAIIASILMKPNYSSYSSSSVTVRYPKDISKEKKIERLINKFNTGLGVNTIIDIN